MNIQTKEMYSEVYGILETLGEKYINKLPKDLYELIKSSKSNSYSPKYDLDTLSQDKSIKRESLSMIALFHLNYWCDTEAEKQELKELFKKNDEKNLALKRANYNLSNVLKKEEVVEEKVTETSLVKVEKDNLFFKILKKIFNFKGK